MADDNKMLRIAEDLIGAAPELGILGLFGFVIVSNFRSGSTTTNAGQPLIKAKPAPSSPPSGQSNAPYTIPPEGA